MTAVQALALAAVSLIKVLELGAWRTAAFKLQCIAVVTFLVTIIIIISVIYVAFTASYIYGIIDTRP